MQDPVREISGVVKALVEAKDATEQQKAVQRYFTQDASFDHPLCAVASRNGVSRRRCGAEDGPGASVLPPLTVRPAVARSGPAAGLPMASVHFQLNHRGAQRSARQGQVPAVH